MVALQDAQSFTMPQRAHAQADGLAQLGALVGGDGDFAQQIDLAHLGDEPGFPVFEGKRLALRLAAHLQPRPRR
ncbi:MAG: hypothetical protein JW850_04340 [Thermoflexales bacterium]|nr:hypothetical protein [Thermoflexales bacterium]